MRNSQYLYGDNFDAKAIQQMPYVEALDYKNRCASALTEELVMAPAQTTDWFRINAIAKAKKFNEALLREAYGRD